MSLQAQAGTTTEDLVVATPEQVAFRFETAGLGSRFVAQMIDLLVLWGVLMALALIGYGVVAVTGDPFVGALMFVLLGLASFCGYLILPEALWSGQTVGKHALHLRVIDARGGQISVGQSVVRNVLRIVDFLPMSYALGVIVMFGTARNQRLGDLAAGTVVIRERVAVSLADLRNGALAPVPEGQGWAGAVTRSAAGLRPVVRLEPRLRRFVQAYAQRRPGLAPERRAQLAMEAEPALRAALPDVVATAGPQAALDQLADQMLGRHA